LYSFFKENNFENNISDQIPEVHIQTQNSEINETINCPITEEEMSKAVKSLKTTKHVQLIIL
jgi:hypothetical protein